ncbi:hypothetical protein [Rhizomonospora bruguierae]|uniref:hypothetical protein n=1 Tax=Rhizomonospora bruguierae TaxID=1581705 RepID=UPI001BD1A891|nr:hypothetical protein [Micromonospora sp. NBRC 107566]
MGTRTFPGVGVVVSRRTLARKLVEERPRTYDELGRLPPAPAEATEARQRQTHRGPGQ